MACQFKWEVTLWKSINTNYPELVESFLKGTLNVATCPACGTSFFVPIPILYNDMRRGLIIRVDEADFAAPGTSKAKSDSGIEGVRYRRRLNRPFQMISVQDFATARLAIRCLDDEATLDSIKGTHPDWPSCVVYAEAFLHHYKRGLTEE